MLKIENIEVSGFNAAFRGLRNPKESWHKSDSYFGLVDPEFCEEDYIITDKWIRKDEPFIAETSDRYEELFKKYNTWLLKQGILRRNQKYDVCDCAFIGPNDMELAQKMILAGDDEAKFTRMIHIQMDIIAPLRWWKEFDTYKVATVRNSCSTMHKLADKPITRECFSCDGYSDLRLIDPTGSPDSFIDETISNCEQLRQLYLETGDKRYWRALIDLLPDGWLMRSTVDFSYQTARHMFLAREHHKQSEWSEDFCNKMKELPYGEELICIKKENK